MTELLAEGVGEVGWFWLVAVLKAGVGVGVDVANEPVVGVVVGSDVGVVVDVGSGTGVC